MSISVGVIGLGFVGGSMLKSFLLKKADACGYDKFKDGGIGTFESMLDKDILFLALPTLFDEERNAYNQDAIYEVCGKLEAEKFSGVVVIKSTVEPESTNKLAAKFTGLTFIHNPEFLTAANANEDFKNQKFMLFGGDNIDFWEEVFILAKGFKPVYGTIQELILTKYLRNSFLATKVAFFNEVYDFCQNTNINYNNVAEMVGMDDRITRSHMQIPGPDGERGFGGACFPKDTKALLHTFSTYNKPFTVLKEVVDSNERTIDEHTDNRT